MKRILSVISLAAALLAAVSCVEPLNNVLPRQDLKLSFSCEVMTKADGDRLAVDNEDLIKQIDYFIFPLNSDGKVDDDQAYVKKGQVVPEDNGLGLVYVETILRANIPAYFPDGATKMMLFAVANYVDEFGTAVETPNETIPETATTWKQLHELKVGETFFYDDGNPNFKLRWPRRMDTDDSRLFFVMTGEKVIELKEEPNVIPLKRLASKVTVNYTFKEKVVDTVSGITWVPDYKGSQVRTYLSNAIEHTTLGAPFTSQTSLVADAWGTATKPLGDGTRDIFEYAYDFLNTNALDDSVTPTQFSEPDENHNITSDKVFHYYTYPIDLDEGDDNQPYLKLVLPWYGYKNYVDAEHPGTLYKQKEVYYKIALPRAGVKEPNKLYEYTATVDIVDNEKEVEIHGYDYVVKDWLSNDAISANVAAGRYISLDIPKDEYDMYTDKLDITFVSSGTVIAIVDEIYQLNYSSTQTGQDYFMRNNQVVATQALRTAKGITNADIEGWVDIPEETSYLRINHAMDNRMLINNQKNDAFDMAPYVFKVTLHLEEDTTGEFDRTVTITQYPALYVTSRMSNGYAFVNGYDNTDDSQSGRRCWDDRGQSGTNTGNNRRLGNFAFQFGSLSGTSTEANRNPNIYTITASILTDYDYVLGDPRTHEVDNLSNLSGLTEYHPTEPSGTEDIIAPKLKIASSYGAVYGEYYFNLETARKRCAAYQENGYPAGRWRVPTAAEIKFMVTLSTFGFIPSLYTFSANDNVGYWSANGKIVGNAQGVPVLNTSSTSNTAVRCVYDAWYWGEEPVQERMTSFGYMD
ncbi:MAG: hypothetical protein IJK90_05960 [Bacteroidales bacterium]|nr:hypothetical protein [Bacteroidales bacterium]